MGYMTDKVEIAQDPNMENFSGSDNQNSHKNSWHSD